MREKKTLTAPTGLILSGGAGERMGNVDKGLVYWQGEPLIAQVCARLRGQVGRILISCNRNVEAYSAYADELVSDNRPGYQGPLAGLESAAGVVSSPLLLIVPCDTPRLPADLALRLIAALQDTATANIAYARSDVRDHYLCALLRTETLASLTPFLDSGGRAVRDWFSTQQAIPVPFNDAGAFLNINRLDN